MLNLVFLGPLGFKMFGGGGGGGPCPQPPLEGRLKY